LGVLEVGPVGAVLECGKLLPILDGCGDGSFLGLLTAGRSSVGVVGKTGLFADFLPGVDAGHSGVVSVDRLNENGHAC